MKALKLLTERQVADIKSEKDEFKQNDKLIELISELLNGKRDQELFLKSLRDTGQSHIANYVTRGNQPKALIIIMHFELQFYKHCNIGFCHKRFVRVTGLFIALLLVLLLLL